MRARFEDKIPDIIKWSIQAFTDEVLEDSLNNSRKAGEAICKAIIFKHYGDAHGENIILGKQKLDGTRIAKPKELEYSDLIEKVIQESDSTYIIISHKRTRHKIKAYLEIIRTHSNPGSHDPNDPKDIIKTIDAKITIIALSALLYWLFLDYFAKNIPYELISHINYNLDIVIECSHTFKLKEIIQKIIETIKYLKIIDAKIIEEFQAVSNSLLKKLNIADKEFEALFEALKSYNKLPRRPGCADHLEKFLKENSILEQIEKNCKKLGVKI